MRKIVLVYNPVSGDALFKYKIDYIIEVFQKNKCIIIPYRTGPSNKESFINFISAIPELYGMIIAGGDGTLNEFINILLAENIDVPIGILPSGTSNDFASFLGINKSIDNYLSTIIEGNIRSIDVGQIADRYFINVASAGVLTSVAHRVDKALKNTLGKMAYYIRGLGEIPNIQPLTAKFIIDHQVVEENIFLFLISNSATVGSLPNAMPEAQIDDGLLDLMIVKQCSLPEFTSLVISLLAGRDIRRNRYVLHYQAKEINVDIKEDVETDLDGELGPDLPLTAKVLHKKLRVFHA